MNRKGLFIFIGIAAVLIIVALVIFGPGRKPPAPIPANLVFWGLESEASWRPVIQKFREKNETITVEYTQIDPANYEQKLINALANGTGPDIFMLKSSQIVPHASKIAPAPQGELGVSPKEYARIFADIASADLITPEGQIIGMPLSLDTLALFYNKDIFNAENIAIPPRTWEEVTDLGRRLTKVAPNGDIIMSGLALGTGTNTDHAMEILSPLMLQSGSPVVERATREVKISRKEAREAFLFYISHTRLSDPNYSWNVRMPHSLDVFAQDRAAMAIGFLSDIDSLRKQNPHLNLGIAPFPQPADARTPLTYGRYTFPTVSKQSRVQEAAWQFLLYAASSEGAKLFLDATHRAPIHRTLIAADTASGELDIFWRQALIARNWPIPDETTSRRLFEQAIDQTIANVTDSPTALSRLEQQLVLLFSAKR